MVAAGMKSNRSEDAASRRQTEAKVFFLMSVTRLSLLNLGFLAGKTCLAPR